MFRRVLLASLLAAIAVPALTLPAEAAPTVAVTGTYRTLVAERVGAHAHGKDAVRDVLVTGTRTYSLSLRGTKPRSGSRITVRGRMSGTTISSPTVTATPVLAAAPVAAPAKKSVLVVLATWTQPDAVTRDGAAAKLFADVDAWQHEVSYGADGFSGDVTPWVRVPGPTNGLCFTNGPQVMAQAKAAALLAGFDAASYARTVLYFPRTNNADCSGYAGWAYQPGTEVWLNGFMDRRTLVHELGHAAGLHHAAAVNCTTNGVTVTLSPTCSVWDYGDPSDAMGGSMYVGHFSAVQKNRLGWLGGRVAQVAPGSSVTLAALESAVGVTAAYVPTGTGRRYWLERRAAVGADAMLPAGLTNGVIVHMEDLAYNPRPMLLDMTPDGNMTNAALGYGMSWTSPEGIVISVDRREARGGGLTVKVSQARTARK